MELGSCLILKTLSPFIPTRSYVIHDIHPDYQDFYVTTFLSVYPKVYKFKLFPKDGTDSSADFYCFPVNDQIFHPFRLRQCLLKL